MYIVSIEYQIGDAVKTATHNANECYTHVSPHDSSCRIMVPQDAAIEAYEAIATNKGEITHLSIANADGAELYNSNYWTMVQFVQNSFAAEGNVTREIHLSRAVETAPAV